LSVAGTAVAAGADDFAVLGLSTRGSSVADEPRTASRTTDTTSVTTASVAATVVTIACLVSYHGTVAGGMSHVLESKALNRSDAVSTSASFGRSSFGRSASFGSSSYHRRSSCSSSASSKVSSTMSTTSSRVESRSPPGRLVAIP
jgi:hypothetical protein